MKPDPHGEAIIEEFLASQCDGGAYLRPHVRTTAYVGLAAIIARALLDAHQRGRCEGMEEAADMIDHGFEKPVGKSYHPNFRSKHDQCPHGLYMYEDCEDCCSNAIRAKAQEVSL